MLNDSLVQVNICQNIKLYFNGKYKYILSSSIYVIKIAYSYLSKNMILHLHLVYRNNIFTKNT